MLNAYKYQFRFSNLCASRNKNKSWIYHKPKKLKPYKNSKDIDI